MRFFRQFWKSNKARKSAFGGEVKSKEEIDELNRQILVHEEKEKAQVEKELEKAQKDLWK